MVVAAEYPLLNIFWTMIIFFAWVIWIWMVIGILADIFGRHDISGWGKAAWCVVLIFVPFIGVLAYLIIHGTSMTERKEQHSQAARADFDDYVKSVATNGGAASEIQKAKQLLDNGTITETEFTSLKAKALA